MTKLTKQQAAIIGAYTGYLAGDFDDLHKYVEKIMKRPVFTHEMGNPDTVKAIKEAAKPDFLSIAATK